MTINKKWAELDKEEKDLLDKEQALAIEDKQIERIEEEYSEHFFKAERFLNELEESFYATDLKNLSTSIFDEYAHEKRKLTDDLDNRKGEIKREKNAVADRQTEIYYDKRKQGMEEEENEY